jgi:hypothetical protein
MLLLTVTEFRNNISKYMKMAFTEKIAVKSKDGIIELTPNKEIRVNPSPSNDSYFEDPQNIKAIEQGIADVKAGRVTSVSLDDIKLMLGL